MPGYDNAPELGPLQSDPTLPTAGQAWFHNLLRRKRMHDGLMVRDLSLLPLGSGVGQIVATPGGSGAVIASGLLAAPTLTATATTVEDNVATWLNSATTAISANPSGIVAAAFTQTRAGRLPQFEAAMMTDSTITSVQYAIGLSSGSLDVNPPGAGVQGAYFRYNTTSDGTAFWRCVTSDGTTRNVIVTTVAIAASTVYVLRIVFRNSVYANGAAQAALGTIPSAIDFYINGILAATSTVNIPLVGTALGVGSRVMTLTTATRNLKTARISVTSGA